MTPPPRVLIVEDQYFVAADCEMHLSAAGFECVGLAATAQAAMEIAEREHPDLIIMDIRLANDVDGVQAAISIYENLGIRSIFSSGNADAIMREQAERAHPYAWLDKPYTGDELIRAARDAVANRSEAPRGHTEEVHAPPVH